MKNINWWKVLNGFLHAITLGIAKLQTLVENKATKKAIELKDNK